MFTHKTEIQDFPKLAFVFLLLVLVLFPLFVTDGMCRNVNVWKALKGAVNRLTSQEKASVHGENTTVLVPSMASRSVFWRSGAFRGDDEGTFQAESFGFTAVLQGNNTNHPRGYHRAHSDEAVGRRQSFTSLEKKNWTLWSHVCFYSGSTTPVALFINIDWFALLAFDWKMSQF